MGKIVSWKEVEIMVAALADSIQKSGAVITCITGIPRGGWTVAALLAQKLGVKSNLAVALKKEGEKREVAVASTFSLKGQCVLVVEDSVGSGKNLEMAKQEIERLGASVKPLR